MTIEDMIAQRAAALVLASVGDVVEERVRRVLEERADAVKEKLEPLAVILGMKSESARKKEQRDPSLKALAVGMQGRTRLYRRTEVLAHLRSKP